MRGDAGFFRIMRQNVGGTMLGLKQKYDVRMKYSSQRAPNPLDLGYQIPLWTIRVGGLNSEMMFTVSGD